MGKTVEWRTKTQFEYGSPEKNNVEVVESEEETYLALTAKTPGSVDVPFTTPANYIYDATKIEVTEGKAKLKVSVAGDHNFPFTTPANYIYDAAKIEVTGGKARLKGTPLTPYAWWHLNESSGAIASDSSGNGRNGTLINMEDEDWGAGKLNNCLQFGGVNEYIDCGDIASFERNESFSVEFWINFTTTSALIVLGRLELNNRGWGIWIGSGFLYFDLKNSPDNRLTMQTNTAWNDGVEHHVVITYDGSSTANGVKFHVDSVLQATIIGSNNLTDTTITAVNFRIAAKDDGNYLIGKLDEIVIYTEILSQDMINFRYNSGVGTEEIIGAYSIDKPNIYSNIGYVFNIALDTFIETATKPSGSGIKYQVSSDGGGTWKWWSGVSWAAITDSQTDEWYYNNESNIASDVHTNIGSLAGSGTFKFRAFLHSEVGTMRPELDNIHIAEGSAYPTGSHEILMNMDIQPALIMNYTSTTETVTKPANTDVKYQYSIDSGTSWNSSWLTEPELEIALKGLPLLKDGSDKVRIKIQLSTSDLNATPEIDNLNLTCDRGYETSGYYISALFDPGVVISLKTLIYELSIPSGTSAAVKVRFSDHPLDPESGYIERASGLDIWEKETDQFQWRVDFTGNGIVTPKLTSLSCGYSSDITFQQESLAKLDELTRKNPRITLSKR